MVTQSMLLIDMSGHQAQHEYNMFTYPDSKVHGAYMGPTWGRQDPGGPHVGPMNLAIWVGLFWLTYILRVHKWHAKDYTL